MKMVNYDLDLVFFCTLAVFGHSFFHSFTFHLYFHSFLNINCCTMVPPQYSHYSRGGSLKTSFWLYILHALLVIDQEPIQDVSCIILDIYVVSLVENSLE